MADKTGETWLTIGGGATIKDYLQVQKETYVEKCLEREGHGKEEIYCP